MNASFRKSLNNFIQVLIIFSILGFNRIEGSGQALVSGRPLRITTIELEPYFMYKNNRTKKRGYGYIPDLLDKLAKEIGFKYDLRVTEDGDYGRRVKDGSWSGMIGDIVSERADLAASPMFITDYRAKVVDFSLPFMKIQATILLRKPPEGEDPYVSSVEELINQSELKYGTLDTGMIPYSFKTSNDTALKIMWRNINRFDKQHTVFMMTNEEGITKVRRDKYAYIIPSTIGEYIANQKPCDLITVDKFLMNRSYALAFSKNNPHVEQFNVAIRKLRKEGILDKLYHKWWFSRSDCNGVRSSKIYSINGAYRDHFGNLGVLLVSFAIVLHV